MNILFVLLSLPETDLDNANGMYIDLAKDCKRQGHGITIIGSSLEQTRKSREAGMTVLRVRSRRIVGEPNLIKKGIAMALLPYDFKRAYRTHFKESKFDWIVMPTPPITLIDFVSGLKTRLSAELYLILRDIHPQSSWSLGEIKYHWMYNYLDRRSRKGYNKATLIGCMSPRNAQYILSEYPGLDDRKMTVLYNWLQPSQNDNSLVDIRQKYGLEGKIIALFGGNIALGQRIENIADLANHYRDNKNVTFVVIGKGVKKQALIDMVNDMNLDNVLFLDYMPQKEYLDFIRSVDIGLISIHENNAAPTCPSKLASYMSMKIPVLAMINRNNDYGQIIEKANAGFWAVASDKEKIYECFDQLIENPKLRARMGEDAHNFFLKNMTTEVAATTMLRQMDSIK